MATRPVTHPAGRIRPPGDAQIGLAQTSDDPPVAPRRGIIQLHFAMPKRLLWLAAFACFATAGAIAFRLWFQVTATYPVGPWANYANDWAEFATRPFVEFETARVVKETGKLDYSALVAAEVYLVVGLGCVLLAYGSRLISHAWSTVMFFWHIDYTLIVRWPYILYNGLAALLLWFTMGLRWRAQWTAAFVRLLPGRTRRGAAAVRRTVAPPAAVATRWSRAGGHVAADIGRAGGRTGAHYGAIGLAKTGVILQNSGQVSYRRGRIIAAATPGVVWSSLQHLEGVSRGSLLLSMRAVDAARAYIDERTEASLLAAAGRRNATAAPPADGVWVSPYTRRDFLRMAWRRQDPEEAPDEAAGGS